MIEILKLNTISDPLEYQNTIEQIKWIFYASSSLKEFSSEERRVAFFKRWCGDYISLFPEHFYIMREGQKVLGYLSGCIDSKAAETKLEVPGYKVYSDLFDTYPAHLHINFHPDCRGRGLGSKLVDHYCEDLKKMNISGVHLITSTGAPNITFYQRLGFDHEVPRVANNMTLVFMGKILE